MSTTIIPLADFLKEPSVFFDAASKEGAIIIEGEDGCFTLSKAKMARIIIPDQETDRILRRYYRSQTAEAHAVDLGLSVKWAAGNLGAIKETDFGGFYFIGETEPRTFGKGMMGNTTDKRKFTGTLPLENDAAYHRLGSSWRVPTAEECRELVEFCEWTYCEDYLGSRMDGWKVSSKIEGFKDNYIFIPAASAYNDPQYDERLDIKGWAVLATSSCDGDGRCGCLNIDNNWKQCEMENFAEIVYQNYNYIGTTIRAVCKD